MIIDIQAAERKVKWAKDNMVPQFDMRTLRYRYDDDPVALAIIDELQGALQHIEKVTDILVGVGQLAVTIDNEVISTNRQRDKLKRDIRALDVEVEGLRAREQKWKALVEEVALATGAFAEPVEERLRELETTPVTEALEALGGDLATKWQFAPISTLTTNTTTTHTWESLFDVLKKPKAKLPRPPMKIMARKVRK